MRNKFELYINHYFRFEDSSDIIDEKNEIVENLMCYYNEFISKGLNSSEAYLESIKKLGFDEIEKEKEVKPRLVESIMILSLIIGVFSIFVCLLNTVVAVCLLLISICIYTFSSHKLYNEAIHENVHNKNIEIYNILLNRSFKNFKQNLLIWSCSLSVILASAFTSLLLILGITSGIPNNMIFGYSVIIFIVLFILSLILCYFIYDSIANKYYLLTGNKLKNKNEYITKQVTSYLNNINNFLNNKKVRITMFLLTIILFFIAPIKLYYYFESSIYEYAFIQALFANGILIGIITLFIIILLLINLIKNILKIRMEIISVTILLLLVLHLVSSTSVIYTNLFYVVAVITLFTGCFVLIVDVLTKILTKKEVDL